MSEACGEIGAKGNPCPQFRPCPFHSGDPEAASAWGKDMAAKSVAARAASKDDEVKDLLTACKFDTLESIETYLETMARHALENSDPRFLTGAARIVETSKWYHLAKEWRDECKAWRKKFGVKQSPISDGDNDG